MEFRFKTEDEYTEALENMLLADDGYSEDEYDELLDEYLEFCGVIDSGE